MRAEDAKTLAVWMFEDGKAPSSIDARMGLPAGFAHDAVVEWWSLMFERRSL